MAICKVLIVEDNEDIRHLLGDIFGHQGYRFVLARDGAEMRSVLDREADTDVVVIDVTLPAPENGFSLAQEMAERGRGAILVTGDHRHYEQVEKSGYRYIFKPFRIAALLELVGQVLTETARRCERPGAAVNPPP